MLFNLLNQPEKLERDVSVRLKNKEKNRELALKFGFEYFDGPREQGYGGYVYDGRWQAVSQNLIEKYNLSSSSKFLDVGCAKGFLMHDLTEACPGIGMYGIDVSEYAKENALDSVKDKITIGSCLKLPYPDDFFDCSVAINTIHNLDYEDCKESIKELIRVTKNKKDIFVQVDAYCNEEEKELFEIWMLTAKTYLQPEEWISLFNEVGYEGDYFWTTIGFTNSEKATA
jgi:SAM-dependent methyltransferase